MTDPLTFTLAVLALLATPGPTNTLLATAGAQNGWRQALRLIPAEVTGYLTTILTLLLLLGPAVAAKPNLSVALNLAAGLWLAYSAVRLWREAGSGFTERPAPIAATRIFITTLLNPKALIFALVIFPPAPAGAIAAASLGFAGMVVLVALAWISFGAAIVRGGGGMLTPRAISRIGAVALAGFAALISGSAIAAII